jgi:hypothetical protein
MLGIVKMLVEDIPGDETGVEGATGASNALAETSSIAVLLLSA